MADLRGENDSGLFTEKVALDDDLVAILWPRATKGKWANDLGLHPFFESTPPRGVPMAHPFVQKLIRVVPVPPPRVLLG
jgi:hypothetical protein